MMMFMGVIGVIAYPIFEMKGEFIPLVRCPTLHFKSLRLVLQGQLVAMTKLGVQTERVTSH